MINKKNIVLISLVFLLSGCSKDQTTYSTYITNFFSHKTIKVEETPTELNSDTKVYEYNIDNKKFVKKTVDETGKKIDEMVCESDILHYQNIDGFTNTGTCVTSDIDTLFNEGESKFVTAYNSYITTQKVSDDPISYDKYTLPNGIEVFLGTNYIKINNTELEIVISGSDDPLKTKEFK